MNSKALTESGTLKFVKNIRKNTFGISLNNATISQSETRSIKRSFSSDLNQNDSSTLKDYESPPIFERSLSIIPEVWHQHILENFILQDILALRLVAKDFIKLLSLYINALNSTYINYKLSVSFAYEMKYFWDREKLKFASNNNIEFDVKITTKELLTEISSIHFLDTIKDYKFNLILKIDNAEDFSTFSKIENKSILDKITAVYLDLQSVVKNEDDLCKEVMMYIESGKLINITKFLLNDTFSQDLSSFSLKKLRIINLGTMYAFINHNLPRNLPNLNKLQISGLACETIVLLDCEYNQLRILSIDEVVKAKLILSNSLVSLQTITFGNIIGSKEEMTLDLSECLCPNLSRMHFETIESEAKIIFPKNLSKLEMLSFGKIGQTCVIDLSECNLPAIFRINYRAIDYDVKFLLPKEFSLIETSKESDDQNVKEMDVQNHSFCKTEKFNKFIFDKKRG